MVSGVTTCALAFDDRLELMYRLAEEVRRAGAVAFRPPAAVPDWPVVHRSPDLRTRAAVRIGVGAVAALAATQTWTAATWVLGAPPRPTVAPTTVAVPFTR